MISSLLGEFGRFTNKYDDDLIDRCSHRYTVMILAAFITVIASKQYYGEPIVSIISFFYYLPINFKIIYNFQVCWTPAQFTGSHISYANAICMY
jgi:hypothetical protein